MKDHHNMDKRKNIIRSAAAGALGAGLFAAWFLTGRTGISEEDKGIYEQAMSIQEQVDDIGFRDFRLADYPVAMYDGSRDYVFYEGEIKKRAPVMETFVGTAYPVEDHFEVIIPTEAQFDKLLSLAGGVEGMISGSGYSAVAHAATLWHEAFHAYQLTNYAILGEELSPEEMRKDLEGSSTAEADTISEEEWIVREVDQKEEIRSKLEKEMKLLQNAVQLALKLEKSSEGPKKGTEEPENEKEDLENVSGIGELETIIGEYEEARRQRLAEMPEEAVQAEIRCELTEGTAYYIEAKVSEMLSGEEAYEEHFLDGIADFEGGRGKYYRTGMAKCLLLDCLDPGWKDGFDFSEGLDELWR